jgi:hypothetical protein
MVHKTDTASMVLAGYFASSQSSLGETPLFAALLSAITPETPGSWMADDAAARRSQRAGSFILCSQALRYASDR